MSDIQTFNAVPSTVPFILSDKFVNLIMGPVGSTKTTASIIKIIHEAKQMAPCRDGIRRSRCAVIRNTNQMLHDTTIPDFLKWYPDGEAGLLMKTGMKFLIKVDDIECECLFRGLDDANDVRRLLSLQLSFAMMDEFREINPQVFNVLTTRLGRYPDSSMVLHRPEWGKDDKGNPIAGCVDEQGRQMKKVWGASNPPDADTFWEQFIENLPGNATAVIQPSGLSPEADWLHCLPSDYYENMCQGKTEDWIDVYVHGKFGKSLQGQPVFRCFTKETHVAKEPLTPNISTLVIGVDAGLNPTAVITQQTYDGRVLVLDAITGNEDGMGALRFCREKLKPLMARKYSGRQHIVVIDPAAFQRAQSDERSVADVFKSEGFLVKPARTNTITLRIAAVESFLTRTVDGKAALLIDPTCTELITALRSRYRYKMNTKGEKDDKPDKNHPWSDYCLTGDALVKTPQGDIPIAQIRVGDVVCVPDGLDVVTAVGTREGAVDTLTFANGAELTCTRDHPIAVDSHTCFLPADELDCDDFVVTQEDGAWANGAWRTRASVRWLVSANSAGLRLKHRLGVWLRGKGSTAVETVTTCLSELLMAWSTLGCGLPDRGRTPTTGTSGATSGAYRYTGMYGSSTTAPYLTGTPYTTVTATRPITRSATLSVYREALTNALTWSTGTPAENSGSASLHDSEPPSGTDPKKDAHGTGRTQLVSRKNAGVQPVFNLTTQRTHLYYANGILNHNCDALQYACLQHDGGLVAGGNMTRGKIEVQKAPYRWAA